MRQFQRFTNTIDFTMKRIIRRKKGVPLIRSKKETIDGIEFKSQLESYMYKALKNAGIYAEYEGISFQLLPPFKFSNTTIERQSNGKGDYKNRNGKVRGIAYTPDFVGHNFIIECKGLANESFPLRWKLFKHLLYIQKNTIPLYKPQNRIECDETVKQILNQNEDTKEV